MSYILKICKLIEFNFMILINAKLFKIIPYKSKLNHIYSIDTSHSIFSNAIFKYIIKNHLNYSFKIKIKFFDVENMFFLITN